MQLRVESLVNAQQRAAVGLFGYANFIGQFKLLSHVLTNIYLSFHVRVRIASNTKACINVFNRPQALLILLNDQA